MCVGHAGVSGGLAAWLICGRTGEQAGGQAGRWAGWRADRRSGGQAGRWTGGRVMSDKMNATRRTPCAPLHPSTFGPKYCHYHMHSMLVLRVILAHFSCGKFAMDAFVILWVGRAAIILPETSHLACKVRHTLFDLWLLACLACVCWQLDHHPCSPMQSMCQNDTDLPNCLIRCPVCRCSTLRGATPQQASRCPRPAPATLCLLT